MSNKYKILLTGGGTGGSVSPLLAIAEELRSQSADYEFLWLGTKKGIEQAMVAEENIKFIGIDSGKYRRYFDLRNLVDPLFIIFGFFEAFFHILKWRPGLILCAGGFVGVPVVIAGRLLRTPVIIHQQDAIPGLANKIMSHFADIITVTFEKSLADYGEKARLTGNPIRKRLRADDCESDNIRNKYDLEENIPTLLILGGGTGAMAINQLIVESIDELTSFCQIIHQTGNNKNNITDIKTKRYKSFEFFDVNHLSEILALSDLVISRCGISTLTELSYFGKPAILIPIPDSHQEKNADIYKEKGSAIILDQKRLNSEILIKTIKQTINDKRLLEQLSKNIKLVINKEAEKKFISLINDLFKEKK